MAASNEKGKVLLVDDDNFLLHMYSMKFSKDGYDVKTATSGKDAIAILKAGFAPNIILMDLVMPVLDGFSTYESMKRDGLTKGICAIMLTNQGSAEDIAKARELGFAGYIVKATTIPSEVVTEVLDIYQGYKK